MKKLMLILLATAVATSAFATIENSTQGEYREFSGAGDRPEVEGDPVIENSIQGEFREYTDHNGNDGWILGWLWVLLV